MAVNLSPVGGVAAQFFTNTGAVLTGGKLYTYLAGTTTPAATYTTIAGNVARTNPVVLDAAGRVPGSGEIWLTQNVAYKFVLYTSTDVLIATYDNISGVSGLTLPIDSSNITYDPPFAGSVPTTVEADLAQTISVKNFGAVGNGVADDTAAIATAELAAYTAGATLVFPAGVYLQNGPRTFRCSISGYGATIKNTIGSEQNDNYASAVVRIDGTPGLVIQGLTVDGNNWSTGFSAKDGANRVTYRDCIAKNCLNAGFNAFYCNESSYINCQAVGVKYNAVGLITADGFYLGACSDMSYLNCIAENFQRIGFVSEGESTDDTYRTRYVSCLAKNGNNCDRSPAQYNTGFWAENTNGIIVDDCTVLDIAGNDGQTSGRVIGVVLNAIGDSSDHLTVLSNTTIGDSSGTLPQGVQINGTVNAATVIVNNVRIKNYNVGVAILANVDSIIVDNLTLVDGKYANSGAGGVVLDLNGGFINTLFISSVKELNPTYTSAEAATINFFSTNGTGLREAYLSKIVGSLTSKNGLARQVISDSTITCRTVNNYVTAAADVRVSNTRFINSSSNGKVFSNFDAAAQEQFANCQFAGFSAGLNTFASSQLLMSNCIFTDSQLKWAISNNNPTLKMINCLWSMSDATECWYGNFYNVTKDTVIIQNCTFYTTATYAIKLWNNAPDYLVLQGNTFNNANLTDMVPTSNVNNVATP